MSNGAADSSRYQIENSGPVFPLVKYHVSIYRVLGREMVQIKIDLPESIFPALKKDKSEMEKDLRLAAAVKWYKMGNLSQERAAELAGMSRAEFIYSLSAFGVTPFQYNWRERLLSKTYLKNTFYIISKKGVPP